MSLNRQCWKCNCSAVLAMPRAEMMGVQVLRDGVLGPPCAPAVHIPLGCSNLSSFVLEVTSSVPTSSAIKLTHATAPVPNLQSLFPKNYYLIFTLQQAAWRFGAQMCCGHK